MLIKLNLSMGNDITAVSCVMDQYPIQLVKFRDGSGRLFWVRVDCPAKRLCSQPERPLARDKVELLFEMIALGYQATSD